MKSIGLDIGTTTICGVVMDMETGQVLKAETKKNSSAVTSNINVFERLQDTVIILESCTRSLDDFFNEFSDINAIGVTGQMHGILYVDREGNAVSPLYSWQDERGNCTYQDNRSYSQYAASVTGYQMASGYGMTTHFYNQENHLIPETAECFCTIPDYIAMKLAQLKRPILHKSMAASLGLFDLKTGRFDLAAAEKLNIDTKYFPQIAQKEMPLGSYQKGVTISMAFGDNQASFLGAVKEDSNILLNIGTGSQISIYAPSYDKNTNIEYRPYLDNTYLMVGAPLCGGASYALLKDFFAKVLEMFGYTQPGTMYEIMNGAAAKAYEEKNEVVVDTKFNGSRENPDIRGSISQLGMDNFTPEVLTLAMLQGICEELHCIYRKVPEENKTAQVITGSGNGIRNNPMLRKIIEDAFQKKLILPDFPEEASCGAARYAAYCIRESYTNKPVFFERNRVWRVYQGGYLFADFMGDAKEDSNYPEEWVASSVHAINAHSAGPLEGLSIIAGTDITLKELIESYPEEMLGNSETLEVLVKYLDSAIRLPLQAHPDRAFSEKYFNSSYGKTEMWLILATREHASICFGFQDKLTKEAFSEIIEKSKTDKNIMDSYLHKIPVKPGEVYLIPAKAVHAIGQGCLILEVQEPTDFTIQPEYWCGEHLLNEQEMYMKLPKDIALDCFDYNIYGENAASIAKKEPSLVKETAQYKKETLISFEDTPCFAVDRYFILKSLRLETAPAIYVVVNGRGIIIGDSYQKEIQKGDYFFLPRNAAANYEILSNDSETLELVVCIPPQK